MALPTVTGRYIAGVLGLAIGEYNAAPIVDIHFQLRQYFDAQQNAWEPVVGDLSIRKRFFLKKSDGAWSAHSIESIVSSLGWDGVSLKSLAVLDTSQSEVQVELENETKGDKQYIGVKFMNPRDYEGQSLTSDPAVVQSLDAKYGAELRALRTVSGKPLKASAPKTATKTAAAASPARTIQNTKNSAWTEFKKHTPNLGKDEQAVKFKESVVNYGPKGKAIDEFTLNDWEVVANCIAEYGAWKPAPPELADIPDAVPVAPDSEEVPVLSDDEDLPF